MLSFCFPEPRTGPSKCKQVYGRFIKTMVRISSFNESIRSLLALLFMGRNPSKTNLPDENPDRTSPITAATGPGTMVNGISFQCKALSYPPRVGDSRSAGIGDQGNVFSLQKALYKIIAFYNLVVFIIAHQGFLYQSG